MDDDNSQTTGSRHLAAAITAMLIWSTSFVATKLAYSTFQPLTLGAARFIIASLILIPIAWKTKTLIRPPNRDLGTMALSGILGITLYFAMENIGVQLTSASNAALIMSSYPAITMLMERIVHGIRVPTQKWLGITMAMIGVMLISGASYGGGDNELLGNIILLGTGIVWALYNFSMRTLVNQYPAVTVSLYQTLTGTAAFIPFALTERNDWTTPTAMSMAVVFYLGIFCSVMAFMLYNYGLRKLSAGTAVSLANLVPVFGVLLSVLVLGESVGLWQLLGGIVVILGVYLSVRGK